MCSRIPVKIRCRIESGGNDYEAFTLDLSQRGTCVSSTLLFLDRENIPPLGGTILVTFKLEDMKKPLTLKGTIKRLSLATSGDQTAVRIGVEFEDTPLELIRLIGTLSKPTLQPHGGEL